DGTLLATNNPVGPLGKLEITGTLTGTGTVDLTPGSVLQLDSAVAATQKVVFGAGGAETIVLQSASPGTIANVFAGLSTGDRIELGSGVTSITTPIATNLNTATVTTNLGNFVLSNISFAAGANPQFAPVFDTTTGGWAIQVQAKSVTWSGGGLRFG